MIRTLRFRAASISRAHEVIGVVNASPPLLVNDREPSITDQRKQHIAGTDRPGDHLDEAVAQLNRVVIL